ncbi:hypothetical protein K438DRAFT_855903 [Mycena galopus ATCC 62051]|nr:hypothetical protein K438DRAFT_855903 [Mycena galopus ATCC 62051]
MSSLLARQESRPSIYSWWSDSNPGLRGPTINLHAAAKPLCSPLSAAMLEIYSSYFPWDYVSWSTKDAILCDLADRSTSEVEASAVVNSLVFPHVTRMLGSPNPGVCISSCRLLQSLLSQSSVAAAVLELKPCEQLLSLLRDKRPGVIREAGSVLYEISKSIQETLRWTCDLVERLASHDSIVPANLKLIARIVSLLGHKNDWVIASARYTLSQIARSENGAHAIVNAQTKDLFMLLKSPNPETLQRIWDLVGRLASHDSVAPAILKLVVRIVTLLRFCRYCARWGCIVCDSPIGGWRAGHFQCNSYGYLRVTRVTKSRDTTTDLRAGGKACQPQFCCTSNFET